MAKKEKENGNSNERKWLNPEKGATCSEEILC